MAKIVIWGAGRRGKRIASRLSEDEVVAFIDSDSNRTGEIYHGKIIIDLKEYMEHYSQYFILISPINAEGIKEKLHEAGIYQYFELLDCPSELQGEGECKSFDEYIGKYEKGKKYGIFGTTFFSIYVYDRLYMNGCHDLFLIPEKNTDLNKLEKIQKCYEYVKIIPDCSWEKYIDEIYITVDGEDRFSELAESELPKSDRFDFTHIIPEYRNPDLRKFKDINKGESCFIVATGPSLRMEDLDIIYKSNVKSFGVNRIYLAFEKTYWKPDYYVVADQYCIGESENEIKNISVANKFVSDLYPEFWERNVPDNTYRYHCHWSFTTGKLPEFSDDLEYGAYGSATVTYETIQIAAYMGFEKIYLLGVDFSFAEDYKSASNHFTDNYYNAKSQTAGFAKEQVLCGYRAAKRYADAHGIKIYNATRGGKLEVFERVNFDELFKKMN